MSQPNNETQRIGDHNAEHLVITLHGIRTFGAWQQRLEKLAKDADPSIAFEHYDYLYFHLLAFVCPLTRWIEVRRFRERLPKILKLYPKLQRLDIVAHSFGTHVAAKGLASMPPDTRPPVHTMIFAGSVLGENFDWMALINEGHVKRMVNDCGDRDVILVLNQLVVPFSGLAGLTGFRGQFNGAFCVNRHFPNFGHSAYFQDKRGYSNRFMRDWWLPLLVTKGRIPAGPERDQSGVFRGLFEFGIRQAGPIKLALWTLLLIMPILYFYGLWIANRQLAYASDMIVAGESIERGNYGNARLALARHLPEPLAPDLRDWEWRYYTKLCETKFDKVLCIRPNRIMSVATSKAGDFAAVQDDDGVATVWNTSSATQVGRPLTTGPNALCVALHPTRPLLAYVVELGCDQRIRIWDFARQTVVEDLPAMPFPPREFVFSGDGSRLVCIDQARKEEQINSLWVWDTRTWKRVGQEVKVKVPDNDMGHWLSVTTDGKRAAVGQAGGLYASDAVAIYDLDSGSVCWKQLVTKENVTAVAISGDGHYLAVGAGFYGDPDIKLWDLERGDVTPRLLKGHRAWVAGLAFDAGGSKLVSGSGDQTIREWDLADCFSARHESQASSVVLHLGSGGADSKGSEFFAVSANTPPLSGHTNEVNAVVASGDSLHFISGGKDGRVLRWRFDAKGVVSSFELPPDAEEHHISFLAWAPWEDGTKVTTVAKDGLITVWSGEGFKECIQFPRLKISESQKVFVSPTGKKVVALKSQGEAPEKSISGVFDLETQTVAPFPAIDFFPSEPDTAKISRNGEWLLFLDARRRHAVERVLLSNPLIHSVVQLPKMDAQVAERLKLGEPSADGSRGVLYDGTSGTMILVDFAWQGTNISPTGQRGIVSVSLSPDGGRIATASEINSSAIYSADSLKRVGPFEGTLLGLHGVAFSPNGRRIALAGDGFEAVKLWDADTRLCVARLPAGGAGFKKVAFSNDGSLLGALDNSGCLTLWRADAVIKLRPP